MTGATYDTANQQLTFGSQALTYDSNGNLTSDGTNIYTWSARNQLIGINGASVAANFSYDAFGRRVLKTINGATTNFVYDSDNPVQEITGASTTNLLTGLGIDEYFTRTDAVGTSTFLTDALGSTLALADPAGSLQAQYTYEAFGGTSVTGLANGNPFSYTGREADGTGLLFLRARYYNPQLQRFISEDPIGFAGGDMNLYAYTRNNPVSFADPFGLCADPGGGGIRYCINAYIPNRSTSGFWGDNRGPSSNGGSYRIGQAVGGNGIVTNLTPGDTATVVPGLPAKPGISGGCGGAALPRKLGGRKIFLYCSGWNGWLGPNFAPPIYYDAVIIEEANGDARVINYNRTSFPALELWQYGGSEKPRLLLNGLASPKGPSGLYEIEPGP